MVSRPIEPTLGAGQGAWAVGMAMARASADARRRRESARAEIKRGPAGRAQGVDRSAYHVSIVFLVCVVDPSRNVFKAADALVFSFLARSLECLKIQTWW